MSERSELRSRREERMENGVKNLKERKWGQAPFFHFCTKESYSQFVDRTLKNGACPQFKLIAE